MSTYKVIRYFTDLQDHDHAYNVGDTFPRNGLTVTQSRLDELAGNSNKQGRALIEVVKEDDFSSYMNEPIAPIAPVVEKKDLRYTKRDIYTMSVTKLRDLATEIGIQDAENIPGTTLKKLIVERLF